jgi:hypothetical protein
LDSQPARHSVSVAGSSPTTTAALLIQRRYNHRWESPGVLELADEVYAIRILDALHDDRPPAVRQHDGMHLI